MRGALAGGMVLAAQPALAGDGFGMATSVVQMLASLLLVVGIILVLYYLAGRFLKLPQTGASRYIRIVETKHLGPKKSLVLVEVSGEYLLLANSGEGLALIKQVEMLEEIEVLEEHAAPLLAVQLREKWQAFAARQALKRASRRKKTGGV